LVLNKSPANLDIFGVNFKEVWGEKSKKKQKKQCFDDSMIQNKKNSAFR